MSRIVQLNGTGKQRDLLVRSIVLALRELASSREINTDTRNQAAYISLALKSINESIDPTVAAWEKRGYWLKADRFRMEWAWTGDLAQQLKDALLHDDWGRAAEVCAKVSTKLESVTLPKSNRLGSPWVGAWEKFTGNSQKRDSRK
ncbi:MAG: hypothetical protein A2Z16_06645 [Chloroflexi bacterium RBG_16_54_18]|nr:MAG: hypothetical protein A2Z16_06645 [Chloroflexi bacterium RBG_16_54_18]